MHCQQCPTCRTQKTCSCVHQHVYTALPTCLNKPSFCCTTSFLPSYTNIPYLKFGTPSSKSADSNPSTTSKGPFSIIPVPLTQQTADPLMPQLHTVTPPPNFIHHLKAQNVRIQVVNMLKHAVFHLIITFPHQTLCTSHLHRVNTVINPITRKEVQIKQLVAGTIGGQ